MAPNLATDIGMKFSENVLFSCKNSNKTLNFKFYIFLMFIKAILLPSESLWGSVGYYRILWGSMGSLWGSMGSLWGSMGYYGVLWRSMG